jgi:hypothetical protein
MGHFTYARSGIKVWGAAAREEQWLLAFYHKQGTFTNHQRKDFLFSAIVGRARPLSPALPAHPTPFPGSSRRISQELYLGTFLVRNDVPAEKLKASKGSKAFTVFRPLYREVLLVRFPPPFFTTRKCADRATWKARNRRARTYIIIFPEIIIIPSFKLKCWSGASAL